MNLNDSFEMINQSTLQGLANLRKVTEINLNAWDQLAASQMGFLGRCLEATNDQAELLKTAQSPEDFFSRQTDLARGLGEQLVAGNRQVADILGNTSDAYQALFESGVEQARTQLDEVLAAVKPADAA